MTSTRLPGKVMKEANHKPLLHYHIERLQKTGFDIVIATTTNQTDEPVVRFAEERNIKLHRGSEQNVLERYFEAATKFNFSTIVRVTSDCPLIDAGLIQTGIEKFIALN